MTLAFLALLGAPYIYDISSLGVKNCHFVLPEEGALCRNMSGRYVFNIFT